MIILRHFSLLNGMSLDLIYVAQPLFYKGRIPDLLSGQPWSLLAFSTPRCLSGFDGTGTIRLFLPWPAPKVFEISQAKHDKSTDRILRHLHKAVESSILIFWVWSWVDRSLLFVGIAFWFMKEMINWLLQVLQQNLEVCLQSVVQN